MSCLIEKKKRIVELFTWLNFIYFFFRIKH